LIPTLAGVDDATLEGGGELSLEDLRGLYVELVPELRRLTRRLAPELEPDDVVQETFVVALRNLSVLAAAASRKAWLYGVAVRLARTRRRNARLRRFFGLTERNEQAADASPLRTLEQREAIARLQTLLGFITTAKRDVFVLYELQGLTGDEVALVLRIPLKTVWTRLFHARKELASHQLRLERIEQRRSGLGADHD
jgi:RNA polymerase sigma-70 factor (ECF subfamily)